MPTFITPPDLSGVGELTASTGLEIVSQGAWRFSQSGYNDGVSFGLSLGYPNSALAPSDFYYGPPQPRAIPVQSGGELVLSAQGWQIPGGNALIPYTDPTTGITYPAESCQILITGAWSVSRGVNSNSYNSFGVERSGRTETDLGTRDMSPWLLGYTSPQATYIIQGSAVEGGARDTFTGHEFRCRITETATSDNSNYAYQSNTLVRPAWIYIYIRRWQVTDHMLAGEPLEPEPVTQGDLAARIALYRNTRS